MSQIHCWAGDSLHSVHCRHCRMFQRIFLSASTSLSCSLSGLSGTLEGLISFLKMLIHCSANMLTSTNVPLRGTHHGWVLSHTLLPALSPRGSYGSHPVYLVSMSSSSRPSGGAVSVRKLEHHRPGQSACLLPLLWAHRVMARLVLPWWLLEGHVCR